MTLKEAIKNREECLKYLEGLGQKASPQNVEAVRWSVKALKFMQAPALTPPNEPLTIEQLREMDEPVWVACKTIEGGDGYWCLCRYGHITTPAGTFFEVEEIPHWTFYRRPPEGEA